MSCISRSKSWNIQVGQTLVPGENIEGTAFKAWDLQRIGGGK